MAIGRVQIRARVDILGVAEHADVGRARAPGRLELRLEVGSGLAVRRDDLARAGREPRVVALALAALLHVRHPVARERLERGLCARGRRVGIDARRIGDREQRRRQEHCE